ncbi:MAG: transcriptional repressor [Kofleriaceae bacterium]|nr:transcriptional repressor [Kofleriaceae bacterium]
MATINVIEQLRGAVRGGGLRATPSRIAVLGLMRTTKAPMTHAEVADKLEGQGWDRATIYRNLTDLAEIGLLRRTDLGDHVWRFESQDGAHSVIAHPHFLCTECGDVECLPDLQLSVRKAPRSVKANNVEVQLRGVCDDCG